MIKVEKYGISLVDNEKNPKQDADAIHYWYFMVLPLNPLKFLPFIEITDIDWAAGDPRQPATS